MTGPARTRNAFVWKLTAAVTATLLVVGAAPYLVLRYAVPLLPGLEVPELIVGAGSEVVGAGLGDLRTVLWVGLGVALVVGIPFFHLVGGRRLSAAHHRHQLRAVRDPLTGLGNHRSFQEQVRVEVERARRYGHTLSVAMLDLDGFRLVNDTVGHHKGDEILVRVGEALSSGRDSDAVFRVGGDEFALLLPHTNAEGGRVVGRRLRDRVAGSLAEVGVSVGIADLDDSGHEVEALLACANAALERAKRRGHSLVVCFNELEPTEWDATLTKGAALRALLEEGEMQVAFQPVLDLDDGSVLGYEALARPPQVVGFPGPAEAFATADRLGLVPELDVLCRRSVLARARDLPSGSWLFLNIAPAALDHDLLDWAELAGEVRAAGLAPHRVVIELTERSRISARVLQREVVAARAQGLRIAVDDVGAGWTGFECLRAAEPDFIKVDRSIVAHAGSDRRARATLASILTYAQVTGAEVIGEGVEDPEVLRLLQDPVPAGLGPVRVRAAQGYLFGRPSPMPAEPTYSAGRR